MGQERVSLRLCALNERMLMARLEIFTGDITDLDYGAIVCPAHKHFIKSRGLSARIYEKAGAEALEKECMNLLDDHCGPGESRLTSGGRLPAKYIIHTITPYWSSGDQYGSTALEELKTCYVSVLELARERGINSIVFPALGAGVNHIPQSLVAHQGLEVLMGQLDVFDRVGVCLHDEHAYRIWHETWSRFYKANSENVTCLH